MPRSGHKSSNEGCEVAGCHHISSTLTRSPYRQSCSVSRLSLLHGLCFAIWGAAQRFCCFWDPVRILWFVSEAVHLIHLTLNLWTYHDFLRNPVVLNRALKYSDVWSQQLECYVGFEAALGSGRSSFPTRASSWSPRLIWRSSVATSHHHLAWPGGLL